MNYFQTKVKYDRYADDGLIQRVTETYLVEAVSFGDAETMIAKELESYVSGEFYVDAITKISYAETFLDDNLDDRYFNINFSLITLVPEKGIEKKKKVLTLMQADTVTDATQKFIKEMETTTFDYEINKVSDTPILGIIKATELNG